MKAVVLHEYGGRSELKYEDADKPKCGADEVLVKMRATSVNPIDYKLRSGAAKARMPLKLPAILGRDVAGEVVEVGSEVKGIAKGARVMALTWATYAEYVAVKAADAAVIPESLNFEQAAAMPLVVTTGAQLMERAVKAGLGQMGAGQTVLVTGALGGVGRTAVHAAKKLGVKVIAGVRGSQVNETAALGADGVVAIDDAEEVKKLTGLDAIADTVGGDTIAKLLHAVKKGGVVGSVLGPPKDAEKFDVRVEAFMATPDGKRLRQLAEDEAAGEFLIPIAKTLPLKEIQEAHRLAEEEHPAGKIILVP